MNSRINSPKENQQKMKLNLKVLVNFKNVFWNILLVLCVDIVQPWCKEKLHASRVSKLELQIVKEPCKKPFHELKQALNKKQ